jgi:hypothetical protein
VVANVPGRRELHDIVREVGMAKRKNAESDESASRESVYRGRRIEVVPASAKTRAAGRRTAPRLYIDGQEIEFEEAEDGVLSHQSMFKVYSSPFELAEDLIKQWGERDIPPVAGPGHGHDDEHEHDHDGEHPHRVAEARSGRRNKKSPAARSDRRGRHGR